MKGLAAFLAAGSAIVILSGGCASMNQQVSTSLPTKLTVRKPTVVALPETSPTQDKGGLTVIVEPVLYEVRLDSVIRDEPRKPALLEPFAYGDNASFFTRYVDPTAYVQPERLVFNVRIINGLNHVVRGAGAVVAAEVDGQQVEMSQDNYSDLINALILPRGELSLKIYGPTLRSLPDACTFGLYFYDFVTATDAAGNPTERQNFQWFYQYATTPEYVSAQSRTVKMIRDERGLHVAKP